MRKEAMGSADPNFFDSVQHAVALPLVPPASERPDRTPEQRFEWGGPEVPWECTVYADEAGQDTQTPEGRPSKARFGSLPEIQSVPRAARYAGFQAILASPRATRVVSDHLSLGEPRGGREVSAAARHAEIWRAI
eukprot:1447513-Pyramimonas_sp.AAC.1